QGCVFYFFFFFFQAEDGIRDGHVTGVQTCALPISEHVERGAPHVQPDLQRVVGVVEVHLVAEAGGDRGQAREQDAEDDQEGHQQIGRASCRERVERSVGGVSLKKKRLSEERSSGK